MRARPHDRRHLDRARNGDIKRCPQCGALSFEFNERFRFEGMTGPAWLCEAPRCGYRLDARADEPLQAPDPIRDSKEIQAQARRTMMKSRAKQTRSEQRIAKTQRRVRRTRKS
jgi:hypothetical protein